MTSRILRGICKPAPLTENPGSIRCWVFRVHPRLQIGRKGQTRVRHGIARVRDWKIARSIGTYRKSDDLGSLHHE
jgi:hypothetical protein